MTRKNLLHFWNTKMFRQMLTVETINTNTVMNTTVCLQYNHNIHNYNKKTN